jgi:uncharacterized protein
VQLTAISIYPVKSCGAIVLGEADVTPRGLADDRRWMVVDSGGSAVTQREEPRLALVRPSPGSRGVVLSAAAMPPIEIPRGGSGAVTVRIWDDTTRASSAGEEAAAWFSRFLGREVTLVYMDDDSVRAVDLRFGREGDHVSFADAFPLLVTTEESLAELNSRMETPLPMERFRPNLVIAGGAAFAEDSWSAIAVGSVRLRVVKPCDRCVVTTVDQATGVGGREPLATLATFRRSRGKVLFGWNAIPDAAGTVAAGDRVTVLGRRSAF